MKNIETEQQLALVFPVSRSQAEAELSRVRCAASAEEPTGDTGRPQRMRQIIQKIGGCPRD
jgi:hypothetical protein